MPELKPPYPIPSAGIEDGAIMNADINASALIALSKMASAGQKIPVRGELTGPSGGTWRTIGNHIAYGIDDINDYHGFIMYVPTTFETLEKAVLVVISEVTKSSVDLDIYIDYGKDGEAENAHSESDTSSTYNLTADEMTEIDISALLANLEAGDYLGMKVILKTDYASDFLLIETPVLEFS